MAIYKSFSDCEMANDLSQHNELKICIATPDYLYFVKNMGIGTSFFHTAQVLIENKNIVTVLFCNLLDKFTSEEIELAHDKVTSLGVNFDYMFNQSFTKNDLKQYYPHNLESVSSYKAYHYLKYKVFDLIIFPDWRGLGFYTLHAKKLGLAFQNTQIWIQAHSTCLWHTINNEHYAYTEDDVRVFHLERKAIELADTVVSPTSYLLDWMRRFGYTFPENTFVQPYLISRSLCKGNVHIYCKNISEVVFFGRLEKRKGLKLFIESIKFLIKYIYNNSSLPFSISFLGKITEIEGINSYDYIVNELGNYNLNLTFLTSLNSDQALEYLKNGQRLAVIPSIADNSPLTVLECIYNEIPFIASNCGGIPEIINQDCHDYTLFNLDPRDLAKRIYEIIQNGTSTSLPASNQSDTNIHLWINAIYTSCNMKIKNNDIRSTDCLVSLCLTHFNRPQYLCIVLEGLKNQTYKNFEVIIVDDGSFSADALSFLDILQTQEHPFPVKLIRQSNKFVCAARNEALKHSSGEYVIFMDDDNYSKPDLIKTFISCILFSGYDVLTCAAELFSEDDDPTCSISRIATYIPFGSGLSPNFFGNCYGDTNSIFKKSVLVSVGGFTSDVLSTWEDYELLLRLEMSGAKIASIPEPLLCLRYTTNSLSRSGGDISNYYRVLRSAFSSFPWSSFGDVLLFAAGKHIQNHYCSSSKASSPTASILASSSEHSLLSLRWLVRRMFEVGDYSGIVSTLLHHYRSSQHFNFAFFEFLSFYLEYVGTIDEAFLLCENDSEASFLSNFKAVVSGKNLSGYIHFVLSSVRDCADRTLLLAKLLVMNDKVHDGLLLASSVFTEAETKYSLKYPAVGSLLKSRNINDDSFTLHTPLSHYLHLGVSSNYLFEYCAPVVSPVTCSNVYDIEDYAKRLGEALHCVSICNDDQCSRLLYDVMNQNTPLHFSDLARFMIDNENLKNFKYTSIFESYCEKIMYKF